MPRRCSTRFQTLVLTAIALCAALCTGSGTAGPASRHEPHPQLQAVKDNSWLLIDRGGITSPNGILAYSGGWYDPDAHALCIFGGGHWNYSGNEVWCFEINALKWRLMYEPDAIVEQGQDQGAYKNHRREYPGALFNPADEPIADARPISKHTYDQMEYIPGLGAFVWGGYSWGDGGQGWCEACPDSWAFDFNTAKWTYLYNGKNPSPNTDAGVGRSAYSHKNRLLYSLSRSRTWTFNPRTLDWREISVKGQAPWSIEGTLEYDGNRNMLYHFGGNYPENGELHRFDIKNNIWKKLEPAGPAPGLVAKDGPGLAFDTTNDVLLVHQSGKLWAYHPKDNRWESLQGQPRPQDRGYIFGRFRYDPVNGGAWLHTWENGQHSTWFYRYKHAAKNGADN